MARVTYVGHTIWNSGLWGTSSASAFCNLFFYQRPFFYLISDKKYSQLSFLFSFVTAVGTWILQYQSPNFTALGYRSRMPCKDGSCDVRFACHFHLLLPKFRRDLAAVAVG